MCKAIFARFTLDIDYLIINNYANSSPASRSQALESDRIIGVETGGCPHTAIREDASINLVAIAQLEQKFSNLDLVFLESGELNPAQLH